MLPLSDILAPALPLSLSVWQKNHVRSHFSSFTNKPGASSLSAIAMGSRFLEVPVRLRWGGGCSQVLWITSPPHCQLRCSPWALPGSPQGKGKGGPEAPGWGWCRWGDSPPGFLRKSPVGAGWGGKDRRSHREAEQALPTGARAPPLVSPVFHAAIPEDEACEPPEKEARTLWDAVCLTFLLIQ